MMASYILIRQGADLFKFEMEFREWKLRMLCIYVLAEGELL